MSIQIRMNRFHNIRDLGGMTTAEGRVIRSGKLIRSEHLIEADEEDKIRLADLIDTAVDFRSEVESEDKPDPKIPGVENICLPILTGAQAGITRDQNSDRELMREASADPAKTKAFMAGMYKQIADNIFSAKQYGRFIRILLEPHEKAVLWHCSAGKDRAGIGTVLVGELLGIEREQLYSDYLLTNDCLDIDGMVRQIRTIIPPEHAGSDETLKALFGADRSYLDAFYQGVEKSYGSMEAYIRDGLMITPEMIEELRSRYLE